MDAIIRHRLSGNMGQHAYRNYRHGELDTRKHTDGFVFNLPNRNLQALSV